MRTQANGTMKIVATALAISVIVAAGLFSGGAPKGAFAEGQEIERRGPGVREATSGISISKKAATVSQHAIVVEAADHDESPPVRSLPRPIDDGKKHYPLEYEGVQPPDEDVPDTQVDTVVQTAAKAPSMSMPAIGTSFPGMSNPQGYVPPDTNGDVGPNHYVQTVNVAMRVWNKDGTPVTNVADVSALWDGFGGLCETTNQGDPIVLYDPIANRWLISQFAFSGGGNTAPFYECVAISTGPNPAGTYHRYAFQSPSSRFPDYPKFGVWPDGYYMTTNEFSTSGGYVGVGAWAFDRAKMLNGQAATMQYFHLGTNYSNFLPADLDGATLPPAGAPNPFVSFDDWTSSPRLKVMNFKVNWTTPSSTTFTAAPDIVPATFDSNLCGNGACVSQPGTSNKLDTLSDRLMFRLAYRNMGSHQSMVVTHTVDANGSDRAGVRWYELRNTGGGWGIGQQGTYAPDATNRFMSSGAMDASGNIAIGYSVSSGSVYPGIRFAGRLASDPAGQLSQGEVVLVNGAGSQTGGGGRWGDYASMSVDPVDDCTFWFTSEYYTSTSQQGWVTRIGTVKFPSCSGTTPPPPTPTPTPTPEPGTQTLTVSKDGTGSGTVTSSPAGITCGGTCSATYASGTTVTLSASASSGSTFAGWSGACSGTGSCVVTMNAARNATATFEASSGSNVTISGRLAGGYGTSGDSVLYREYKPVTYWGTTTPNLAPQKLTFNLQRWNGTTWASKGSWSFSMDPNGSSSTVGIRFPSYSLSRGSYRIMSSYAGDTTHGATATGWALFRVTR